MWGNYFYLKRFPHVITYKGISTSFVTVNNKLNRLDLLFQIEK